MVLGGIFLEEIRSMFYKFKTLIKIVFPNVDNYWSGSYIFILRI